ncbi:hypothetical protein RCTHUNDERBIRD_51 [Rhodobacter phage RcThunderbird]|nr:hypothetical protein RCTHUNDERBIRD_51 [Rhodobacter phage RcThunderbird]
MTEETTKEAVARIVKEFARGCSESGKNPANCGACFDGVIDAIMSVAADREREACERIADMLQGDDGEAWFEAEKFLKRHAPDLYNEIGMSSEPLPDFPEPTLFERFQGAIVGILFRKPMQ